MIRLAGNVADGNRSANMQTKSGNCTGWQILTLTSLFLGKIGSLKTKNQYSPKSINLRIYKKIASANICKSDCDFLWIISLFAAFH